jgi:hypothetical protein
MTSFNARLQQAGQKVDEKMRQEELENALIHESWEASQAQELQALELRTNGKLKILHSLVPWLKQGRRTKQLKRLPERRREVLTIFLPDHRFSVRFCIDSLGNWSCANDLNSEQYSLESSMLFLKMLDAINIDDIARGIAELAYEHGWQLPNIDVDVPDEETTSGAVPQIEHHPKWSSYFNRHWQRPPARKRADDQS